jgi:hypothetical protein
VIGGPGRDYWWADAADAVSSSEHKGCASG